MKFWIDEDLSPTLVTVCNVAGFEAASNRDRGLLGGTDAEVLARCIDEDRILVTNNAGDFRALCTREKIHPGLIVLPSVPKSDQQELMRRALEAIAENGASDPRDWMVNRVVEVDADGAVQHGELPPT